MARRPSARLSLIAFAIFVTTSVGCSRSGPVHSRVCAEWVLLRFIDQLDGESAGFILPVQSRPFELQDVFRQGRFVNSEDDVVDEELAALPDSADLPSMLARDTENYLEVRRTYSGVLSQCLQRQLPRGGKGEVWLLHRFAANNSTYPLLLLPNVNIVLSSTDALSLGICVYSEDDLRQLIEHYPDAPFKPVLMKDLNSAGAPVLKGLEETDLSEFLWTLRAETLERLSN